MENIQPKKEQHNPNELVQYYIVNKDLIEKYNMSGDKISTQTAHGATIITKRDHQDEKFLKWYNSIMRKVTLEASEKQMLKLMEISKEKNLGFVNIIDKGYTCIPPDSFTIIAFPIMTREEALPYTKRLQLYKDKSNTNYLKTLELLKKLFNASYKLSLAFINITTYGRSNITKNDHHEIIDIFVEVEQFLENK